MRYDLEAHTDWVALKTLDVDSKAYVIEFLPQPKHIYCEFIVEEGKPEGVKALDGSQAYRYSEPWIADPCRPVDSPSPEKCEACGMPFVSRQEETRTIKECLC